MKEIWRDIEEYKGLYQISNLGRIRSLDKKDSLNRRVKGKIMKPIVRKDKYLCVKLHKNSICKEQLIHRLVANAFIENKYNYKEINHKDENKQNNCVNNLEWCNRSYNINYGKANEMRRKALLNKRGKKVIQIDKNNKIIGVYQSIGEAYRITNISKSKICMVCKGQREKVGNYFWQYIEQ